MTGQFTNGQIPGQNIAPFAGPSAPRFQGLKPLIVATSLLTLLAACNGPVDSDLRAGLGGFSTTEAARGVTANRPAPDNRGIISYPGYQVAVARRDDTVATVAARVGVDAATLAHYNGLNVQDPLNTGAVLAMPGRVSEPLAAGGAGLSGDNVDISQMAGSAIDQAPDSKIAVATLPPAGGQTTRPAAQTAQEPIRHRVVRGETAFTIARLYGVSVRALSDWNGLDANFTIREGQYLLIPVVAADGSSARPAAAALATTAPGAGSPTPLPPSSSKPLPSDNPPPLSAAPTTPKTESGKVIAPDLSAEQAKPGGKLGYPVQGRIIREYEKGKSDGIDLAADPGIPVKAAGAGTVAAIIQDTDNRSVIVVKHADNLLTLYSNVEGITVKKGDPVERGQQLARISSSGSPYLHFEVRKGLDTVDPMTYLK